MIKKLLKIPLLSKNLAILRHYFPDAKVFIHGSLAQDSETFRDIDIIIVSYMFSDTVGIKRAQITCEILGDLNYSIDPICLTPKEFQRFLMADNIFTHTIKEKLYPIL